MNEPQPSSKGKPLQKHEIFRVKDIFDFYHGWQIHGQTIKTISKRKELRDEERLTLEWVIKLVDRITERDLDPT